MTDDNLGSLELYGQSFQSHNMITRREGERRGDHPYQRPCENMLARACSQAARAPSRQAREW